MARWTAVPYGEFHRICPVPGVYAIYFDDRLVYIGQSSNMRTRISAHCIRQGYSKYLNWGEKFNVGLSCYVKVSPSIRYGDWAMRELRLIKRLQPSGNHVHCGIRRIKAAA
jgi:predicted GIY-YIG superfamily endonuclease